MGRRITKPKLLLVEGKDEVTLFGKLLADLAIENVEIRDIMGKTRFRERIKALPQISGFGGVASIGIVRDADTDPRGAFDSICGALQAAGLPRPTEPLQPAGDDPRVMVMILPDAETPGMLEDLCLESVADDPAMACVVEYFRCLQDRLEAGVLPGNPSKARVRTFLASMEWLEEAHFERLKRLAEHLPELPDAPSVAKVHAFLASRYKPDLDLGIAAQAGYWQLDHAAFARIKQFLIAL